MLTKLEAEQKLAEAIAVISSCPSRADARERLQGEPPNLSAGQATYLLRSLRLGALTNEGRRQLAEQVAAVGRELEAMGANDE